MSQLISDTRLNLRLPTRGGIYAWEFEKSGRELNGRVEGQTVFNITASVLAAALGGLGLSYLAEDKAVPYIPVAMGGQARPHALVTTVAWFTPTAPGRKRYRSARLKLLETAALDALSVRHLGDQPDGNQTNKGTLFMRRWAAGDRAPVVGPNMTLPLIVQRDSDQGASVDDPVPFGLAVTLAVPGVVQIYERVRQRLGVAVRATA